MIVETNPSRYECGHCGKKRYHYRMLETPLPNKNNPYTYFCKTPACLHVASSRIHAEIKKMEKLMPELKKILQLSLLK